MVTGHSSSDSNHSALTLTGPDGTQYKLTSQGKIGEEIRPDGTRFILSDSGIMAVGIGDTDTIQFVWELVCLV